MTWNWRAKAVIRIFIMPLQCILDHFQLFLLNHRFSLGNVNCSWAKTEFSSAAWRFRPQRKRRKKLIYYWAWMRGTKKGDKENLSPLDYHLQKYNFMINDSFVPEKKIILFSHIFHSCAWNDNSSSFPYSLVLLNVFSSFFSSSFSRWTLLVKKSYIRWGCIRALFITNK